MIECFYYMHVAVGSCQLLTVLFLCHILSLFYYLQLQSVSCLLKKHLI